MASRRFRRGRPAAAGLLSLVVALAGCAPSLVAKGVTSPSADPSTAAAPTPAASPSAEETPAAGTSDATPVATSTPWPHPSGSTPPTTPRPTPSRPTTPAPVIAASGACVARTLASMSEAQRIGQLFAVGLGSDTVTASDRAAVAAYHFGSFWFASRTGMGVSRLRGVSSAIQRLATHEATDGVRFFVAANQEGGQIQSLFGPGFETIPSALAQGTMSAAALVAAAARWGGELRAAGVNLDFAPVADVVPAGDDRLNAPIGQLEREYGHDPSVVAAHVAAFVEGMARAGIATTAKHFPGLGRVMANTDFASGVSDTATTMTDPYLTPFRRAVSAGVPFVMVSLATYERIDPAHIAAFSPLVITTLLRSKLGFRGVVMSDGLTAEAVAAVPAGERAIAFLLAGGDMIVVNDAATAETMARAVAATTAASASFRRIVHAAVARILTAKARAGLVACQ